MKLDAEIDRLHGLPLDEFVGERDKLAKRLRGDDREAAKRIKQLRKPTVGAWALNQAVRRRGREREALLAAGEQLREAHEALLSGGDPSALRAATKAERALVATLADTAEAIATEAGKGGPALKERVRATLHAAAVDEQARDELAAGRVVRERDAVGMGPFGAAVDVSTPQSPEKPSRRGGARGGGDAHDRSSTGAKRRRAGADGQASAADEKRAAAERERAAAERQRAEQLAAAEHSLAEASTARAEAEAAHEHAASELESARQALADAQAAVRETRRQLRERAKEATKRERELERLRSEAAGTARTR